MLDWNVQINIFSNKIGKATINQQKHAKYLGTILDEKLAWKPHLEILQKKLSSAVWALFSLRSVASGKTLKLIYYALVHSKMTYCLSVWGGVSTSRINPITVIQKRALRAICKVPYRTHTVSLFKEQSILRVADLYKHEIACIIYKNTHWLWRGEIVLNEVSHIHNHNTRQRHANRGSLFLPKATNDVYKRSISYTGPSVWNDVPEVLKCLEPPAFKVAYNRHLLSTYSSI